jgi:glycosyltransferase involved in cell wall biosynthesis
MLPSWYPTDNDPIGGSFFKEQASALERDFDFLVAIVSFERRSLAGLLRILLRRGSLRPHAEEHDYQAPPRVFKFVGYGIKMGRLRFVLPFAAIKNAIDRLNDSLERRVYLKACEFATESFDFRPDLIYAMTAQINAIQATDLGRALGIPTVIAEHVPFSIDAIPERNRDRLRRAIEGASAVLTVSHDKTRQLLMGNIDCHPIVVGNMVDETVFSLTPNSRHDPFTILIVAAYNFYKDYPTFLRSMARLEELTKVPFRIKIVGIEMLKGNEFWSGGLRRFSSLFDQFKLAERTEIAGFVSRSEMIRCYHDADVFVLTSIQEGLPVSVLEAMSCGLPIFATRCGGVEDVVDETCGRILPVRDSEGIAEALRRYIEGDVIFNPQHIRDTIVERYGVDAFRKRIGGVFMDCMSKNHAQRRL